MKIWLQKLIDISALARTKEMLKEALSGLTREFGFDYYAYLNVQPSGTSAFSNYPADWQERYFTNKLDEVDPIVAIAKSTMRTFVWSSETSKREASKPIRRFYTDAADFGIRSGITIPVATAFGRVSMLTVASHKPSISLAREIDQVAAAMAVAQLHARIEQAEFDPTAESKIRLTLKQAKLLKWSAEGKSMRAMATIENMTYSNVNFQLNKARKALDAGTLPQATALATKLKLI
ncbi:autoinducer binding domain-containing protein [Rhizobium mongolense]|uniref:autoinducer-binding transcriptional regulator TraR n=1 Tax=Rhizobium mongolense TaxID=57676 RepID=UPI0035561E71